MIYAFSTLLPFILLSAVLLAVSAWVLMKAKISWIWKLFAVALAFVVSVIIPVVASSNLGVAFPVQALPERTVVLAHKTIVSAGKKIKIEVWVSQKPASTRLLSVPYSKQLEEILKEAEKARAQGIQTEVFRTKKGDQQADKSFGQPEFGLDFKRPEDLMPKKPDAN